MIQYLYKQRNNRDLFMKNGEYSQIDNMDIHFDSRVNKEYEK